MNSDNPCYVAWRNLRETKEGTRTSGRYWWTSFLCSWTSVLDDSDKATLALTRSLWRRVQCSRWASGTSALRTRSRAHGISAAGKTRHSKTGSCWVLKSCSRCTCLPTRGAGTRRDILGLGTAGKTSVQLKSPAYHLVFGRTTGLLVTSAVRWVLWYEELSTTGVFLARENRCLRCRFPRVVESRLAKVQYPPTRARWRDRDLLLLRQIRG